MTCACRFALIDVCGDALGCEPGLRQASLVSSSGPLRSLGLVLAQVCQVELGLVRGMGMVLLVSLG